jgi:hypothetical protein
MATAAAGNNNIFHAQLEYRVARWTKTGDKKILFERF